MTMKPTAIFSAMIFAVIGTAGQAQAIDCSHMASRLDATLLGYALELH